MNYNAIDAAIRTLRRELREVDRQIRIAEQQLLAGVAASEEAVRMESLPA